MLARAAVLFVLGLGLTALGATVKEILTVYAVLFVLALPLRRLPTRPLALVAAMWTVAGPVLSFVLRAGPIPPGPPGRTPDPAALTSWTGWSDTLRGLLLDGPYPVLTWVPFLLWACCSRAPTSPDRRWPYGCSPVGRPWPPSSR